MFFCGISVHAYIDPSVVTYALQAVSGIIVSLSTLCGIILNKIMNSKETIKYETIETDNIHMWDTPDHP